jgi:hypothetical protein
VYKYEHSIPDVGIDTIKPLLSVFAGIDYLKKYKLNSYLDKATNNYFHKAEHI